MTSQRANEEFYHDFISRVESGDMGNCALAIEEVSRPDVKMTKSALMGNVLRIGDVENHPEEAIELNVKTSKCTALARPKSWKKFARMGDEDEDIIMRSADDDEQPKATFVQLAMQSRYMYDPTGHHNEDDETALDEDIERKGELVEVEKEELIRGYKYGTSYVPVPEDNFPRLETKKGIDITGFIHSEQFRREWAMGETQYVWADPSSPVQQVAMSSIVKAMTKENVMAIGRWVTRDGMDPKMGVLIPMTSEGVDHLLWVQVRTILHKSTHIY